MLIKAGIIAIALSFANSGFALAQTQASGLCQDRMTQLRGDRFGFQQINKTVYNAAAKALDHFRQETKTEPVIRQYVAYYRIETGTVTGYRYTLSVRDRSSDAEITYYSDVSKRLVYAKKTSAPEKTYWFCE